MNERNHDLIQNRRARYEYEILETFEAGLLLQGTEIKSLREHGGNLQEAYVKVLDGAPWLVGCSIAPYRFGNVNNHVDKRDRKLLMHKREIAQLKEAVKEKGLTIVALEMYLNKNGIAKIRIAIAKGKKIHDKREAIKERDVKRRMRSDLE